MFGWLQALFLDAKARDALDRAKAPSRSRVPAATPPKPAQTKPAPTRRDGGPAATEQRARLLREAAEIHRAKRRILDALSDEDRARLVSMAILTFMNQGTDTDPKTRK